MLANKKNQNKERKKIEFLSIFWVDLSIMQVFHNFDISLCLVEFFLLLSLANTTTAPLFLQNTSDLAASPAASQPELRFPDERFRVTIQVDTPKLIPISCLMSTVEFLVSVGLRDSRATMGAFAWKLNTYPEVGINISPNMEGGRVQNRFVIWGLSHTVAQMIHHGQFRAVTITLICTYSLQWHPRIQTSSEAAGNVLVAGTICRLDF